MTFDANTLDIESGNVTFADMRGFALGMARPAWLNDTEVMATIASDIFLYDTETSLERIFIHVDYQNPILWNKKHIIFEAGGYGRKVYI